MASLRALFSPVEATRFVDAPPEAVFAVLSDPETYPDWLVGAQRIRAVDPSFPRPGAEFQHSVGPAEAATVDDSTEVTAAEPPHRLELEVHVGPLDGTVELLAVPDREGTEVRFREAPLGWARPLLPFMRPLLHGRNAESLRRLEELVLR